MASSTAMSSAGRPAYIANTPSSVSSANPMAAGRPRGGATNGVSNRARSHNDHKAGSLSAKETNTPDKHAHDRLLFLAASFIGRPAKVTVKNGHQFAGIFSGSSFEQAESYYVLKMARKLPEETTVAENGPDEPAEEFIGYGVDHVMTFDLKDVVDLTVTEVSTDTTLSKLSNGASSSFRTDTDISGNGAVRERELQRWEPTSDVGVDLSLSTTGNTAWDQFETNERLYGVKTDYDENFYTTSIDRSHPSYKQKAVMAEKLAREIEGSSTTNAHVAEERGQVSEREGTLDEEDKYSGVRREFSPLVSNQNRYTPPARRAPTGHTTVPGAPVDPAIISAQLVRPDSSVPRSTKTSTLAPTATKDTQMKDVVAPTAETAGITSPSPMVTTSEAGQQPKLTATLRHEDEPAVTSSDDKNRANLIPASVPAEPPVITVNNGTTNVEKKVLNDFKEFAMHEKMRMAERGREHARNNARKDFEMKVNDLKKFASNFKLKSAVPEDMLGILAKDKHKQIEIVERSQRQQKEAEQARVSNPVSAVQSPTSSRPEATSVSPTLEKQQSRTGQSGGTTVKAPQTSTTSSHPPPGQLGQRLMAQPQYRDRPMAAQGPPLHMIEQRMLAAAASAQTAELEASRSGSITSLTTAAMSRFNVQALEFKPNPAASAFSPRASRDEGMASPLAVKASAVPRSPVKASFFGNRRPRVASDRLSLADSFNPIARMKREETEKDPKKFAANGGIPQAYRTLPTWQVAEANKEKSYVDMFDKVIPISVAPGVMAHQHQLPVHLQPGHHIVPQVVGPQQQPLHPQHHFVPGRDHPFDDHRMHVSSSTSSVFPSPRFQQPMLAFQPSPMLGHMQPGFAQPVGQYAVGPNGPLPQLRQFPGAQQFQGPHLSSTPMMVNHSSGGSFMNMPIQQMPTYSPGQNGVFPNHINGAPNGFSSPRMAPPMVHQGSQQGQNGQPYVFLNPQQVYIQPHPAHMQQMRGGMPLMAQNFPNSPHLQQHFPQHRGNAYGGNFNPQQMGPIQNAQHQMPPQTSSATHGEPTESK